MTPPFNSVIDGGRWFDGRHVCRNCFEELYNARLKEITDILEKAYPGDTKKSRFRRCGDGIEAITVATMNCKNITGDVKTYEDWKKKMEKKITGMKK
jgi:hypothetical protein